MPDGQVNHDYFQKAMKTPYVIMKRSAISQHQKISILSNELVRRVSNTNHKNETMELAAKVTEKFTKEMKFSGYSRVEIKEVIASGLLGWKRKIKRREDAKEAFYRSAGSTLPGRCKK